VVALLDDDGAPFSPQAWGCTGLSLDLAICDEVFPTGVGVYRDSLTLLLSP